MIVEFVSGAEDGGQQVLYLSTRWVESMTIPNVYDTGRPRVTLRTATNQVYEKFFTSTEKAEAFIKAWLKESDSEVPEVVAYTKLTEDEDA